MNSRGLVVPDYVDMNEIEAGDDFRVVSDIGVKFNAFGNNILVNDKFALVHQRYDVKTVREIADVLDVETERGTIAGFRTVGSAAVVTNKGLLVHPLTKPDELDHLKDLFKVPGNIGSANFGVGQVGACLVANSRGAVAGIHSTGIELGRIEDALEIY
jgi:translation initiation factor 6